MVNPGEEPRRQGEQGSEPISTRRRLLGALVSSSIGLVGCVGDSASPTATDTPTGTSADEPSTPNVATPTDATGNGATATPTTASRPVEETFDWSPQSLRPSNWDLGPGSQIFEQRNSPISPSLAPFGANATHPTQEHIPLLLAENELVDGTTWRNTIAEDFSWHDGDPVTADDRYYPIRYEILRRQKMEEEQVFSGIERVDDRTVELELASPRVPELLLSEQEPWIRHKGDLYEPRIEELEDATSKREVYLVDQELKNTTIRPSEWVGNGLFQVTDVTPEAVIFEQYEDFPERYREAQNIEIVRVPIIPEGGHEDQFIVDETTDWHNWHVLPIGVPGEDTRPDRYRLVIRPSTKQYKLRLNHTNPHLRRSGVRRALAYLMEFEPEVEDFLVPVIAYRHAQDGMPKRMARYWLPDYDDRVSNYIDYKGTTQAEQAERELKRAGYTKNSEERWVGPDGEVLEVKIRGTEGIYPFKYTVHHWFRVFGIDVSYEEAGSYWDLWDTYDADWDLLYGFHARGPEQYESYHPAAAYRNDAMWGTVMTSRDADGNRVPAGNRQLEYELPTEIGATDLSGDTRTVNIPELQDRLTDPSTSAETVRETVRTLSWWWNFHVPDVIAVDWNDHFVGDYESFEWRDWDDDGEGDARNHHQLSFSLNTGYVRGTKA